MNQNDLKVDPIIALIANLRKKLKHQLKEPFSRRIGDISLYRQEFNIITDALVYTILKSSKLNNANSINQNPVFEIIDNAHVDYFITKVSENRITFDSVFNTILKYDDNSKARSTNNYLKEANRFNKLNPSHVLTNIKLNNKLEIRTALQMYLLKNNFNWVHPELSDFRSFLANDKQDSLNVDARINCWEAVLYGMLKSKMVTRNFLKEIYKGSNQDISRKLSEWFDFRNAKPISDHGDPVPNWNKTLADDSYLIMMGKKHGWGLSHDMVSFPYSQKQILKMLITENFDEQPQKTKLFSHWRQWTNGKIGSVTKEQFQEELTEPDKDVRITSLSILSNRATNFELKNSKQTEDRPYFSI